MKKFKIIFFVILSFLFSACQSSDVPIMVKAINIYYSEEGLNLSFISYDLEKDDESYISFDYNENSLSNSFIKAVNENNFNLSVCEYVFLNINTLNEGTLTAIVDNLIDFNINKDVSLLVFNDVTVDNIGDINFENTHINPLYGMQMDDNVISTLLPVLDEKLNISDALIISKNKLITMINKDELNLVLSLLSNNKNYKYTFNSQDYIAKIKKSYANFDIDKGVLNLSVFIQIEERIGINDTQLSKDVFDLKLSYDIQNKIYGLYNDNILIELLYLDWIETQANEEIEDLIVKVNII